MPPADTALSSTRGLTPRELSRLLRVSPDKVRRWIVSGELPAVNVASVRCGRPQYVVLPHQLAEWERGRQAAPAPKPKRRRRTDMIDYYPDGGDA